MVKEVKKQETKEDTGLKTIVDQLEKTKPIVALRNAEYVRALEQLEEVQKQYTGVKNNVETLRRNLDMLRVQEESLQWASDQIKNSKS